MRVYFAVLSFLAIWHRATYSQPLYGAEVGDFDYHVLSYTWTNSFCCFKPENPQCEELEGSYAATHLGFHGLWPQFSLERYTETGYGYPTSCGECLNVECDADKVEVAKFTPEWNVYAPAYSKGGLSDHEYDKHGSCTHLSQGLYFQLGIDLMKKYPTPEIISENVGKFVKVSDIQEAFGGPDWVGLGCDEDQALTDVFICFPNACQLAGSRVSCKETTIPYDGYTNGCVLDGLEYVYLRDVDDCEVPQRVPVPVPAPGPVPVPAPGPVPVPAPGPAVSPSEDLDSPGDPLPSIIGPENPPSGDDESPPSGDDESDCIWSDWLDRDNPSGTGDWEITELFTEGEIGCAKPVNIECREKDTLEPHDYTGQVFAVDCALPVGLVCRNDQNYPFYCHDYEVRYQCCPESPPSGDDGPCAAEEGSLSKDWLKNYNGVDSSVTCCEICREEDGCVFWTYRNVLNGAFDGLCKLHGAEAKDKDDSNYVRNLGPMSVPADSVIFCTDDSCCQINPLVNQDPVLEAHFDGNCPTEDGKESLVGCVEFTGCRYEVTK